MDEHMDEHEAIQALRRLEDLWAPWYKIRRNNGLWHAKRRDSADQFHAASPRELNLALIRHFMGDMRLAQLPGPMAIVQEAALAEVRRKHCTRWDHIGPDADTPGWRASRTISPGVTHHIVTRTIDELDLELAALEAADDDETPVG